MRKSLLLLCTLSLCIGIFGGCSYDNLLITDPYFKKIYPQQLTQRIVVRNDIAAWQRTWYMQPDQLDMLSEDIATILDSNEHIKTIVSTPIVANTMLNMADVYTDLNFWILGFTLQEERNNVQTVRFDKRSALKTILDNLVPTIDFDATNILALYGVHDTHSQVEGNFLENELHKIDVPLQFEYYQFGDDIPHQDHINSINAETYNVIFLFLGADNITILDGITTERAQIITEHIEHMPYKSNIIVATIRYDFNDAYESALQAAGDASSDTDDVVIDARALFFNS